MGNSSKVIFIGEHDHLRSLQVKLGFRFSEIVQLIPPTPSRVADACKGQRGVQFVLLGWLHSGRRNYVRHMLRELRIASADGNFVAWIDSW